MRWKAILFALFLLGFSAVSVHADGVSARLASAVMPLPTFHDVHRAYMRIVVNESGFKSLADQDGILQALLWQGGGRKPGRYGQGQGYGLDYRMLMKRMAAHSTRTFPSDSKFLLLTNVERALLRERQTRQNRWTSTLQLDCSEPEGWKENHPWEAHYGERCQLVVETTRAFLQGKMKSYCDGNPTTWGSHPDTYRVGGPHQNGWLEIFCNRPNLENPKEDCSRFDYRELLNSETCAANRFWSWLEKENEDADGELGSERTVSERRNDSSGSRSGERDTGG